MPMLGDGPLGEFPLGGFLEDGLSVASTLNTLLEQPERPRSWWVRARPNDTEFDMYLRLAVSGSVNFGNITNGFIGAADSFSVQIRLKQNTPYVSGGYILFGKKLAIGFTAAGYTMFLSHVSGKVSANVSDGIDSATSQSAAIISRLDFEMYTMVVDRSVNELLLYRNKTEDATADITSVGSLSNTENLFIGKLTTGVANGCDVDEFRFWSKALTPAEIAANYDAEFDPASLPANLEIYCRMNEGTGSVLTDETSNGFNGTIIGGSYLPVLKSVNLSTDGHRTYPSDAEEIQLEQAVLQPYSIGYRLPDELYGQAETSFGSVVIADPSLSRRGLAGLEWSGRDVDIYIGPRRGTQLQFTNVGKLLSRSASYDSSMLTLIVDDHGFVFDSRLQGNFYGGTGGLDGGTEIEGQPIPIWIGIKRQVEPKLVDAVNLIYQLNDGTIGAMDSVLAVRDQGIAKAFDVDVADITTATPGVGEYATSLAGGYIKLGDKNGTITVDAQGLEFPSYGYIETISDLIKGLAVDFAGLLDPDNFDPVAFASLSTEFTGKMGEYFDKPITIRGAMNVFHKSALSWGWMQPNKVLTVGRITNPDSASDDFTADTALDEVNLTPWRMDKFELPVGRVIVGYRRYPRKMNESELSSSVTIANRQDYAQEYRYVKVEDAKTYNRVSDAIEIVILTDLDAEADAIILANEQLAMRKVINRRKGKVSLRTGLISRGVGNTFTLTDARLPEGSKRFVIIGVRNIAASQGNQDTIEFDIYG